MPASSADFCALYNFFQSADLGNTNETPSSSIVENAERTDGWVKINLGYPAVEDFVYAHYTKRGVWLAAANCSLGL
jgi:hypothetical protein